MKVRSEVFRVRKATFPCFFGLPAQRSNHGLWMVCTPQNPVGRKNRSWTHFLIQIQMKQRLFFPLQVCLLVLQFCQIYLWRLRATLFCFFRFKSSFCCRFLFGSSRILTVLPLSFLPAPAFHFQRHYFSSLSLKSHCYLVYLPPTSPLRFLKDFRDFWVVVELDCAHPFALGLLCN